MLNLETRSFFSSGRGSSGGRALPLCDSRKVKTVRRSDMMSGSAVKRPWSVYVRAVFSLKLPVLM